MRWALLLVACLLPPAVLGQSQTALMKELEVMPVPGPESEVLKADAGVWDAVIETRLTPGEKAEVSSGVESSRLISGGLWLVSDFKGTMAGKPYEGHGIYGYDPQKKLYVGVWVDSLQTYFATWIGTYDAAKRTMTQWAETPDYMGRKIRWKSVTEWKGKEVRVWRAFANAADGTEFATTTITYRRRKQ